MTVATSPPGQLAAWTRISDQEAVILYNGLAVYPRQPRESKAVLAGIGPEAQGTDLRLRRIEALCRAAADAGVLPDYCRAIVGQEAATGRPPEDIAAILTLIGAQGTAHALTDRARGLIPTTLFRVLDGFSQALGYVEIDETHAPIGTVLLVRRNLVLTCAHVAFEAIPRDGRTETEPPTRAITRIVFPSTPGGPQHARLAVSQPLAHFSPAHLAAPGAIKRDVDATTMTRLDFALLRLDRMIDRVRPLAISGRDVTADGRLSFLLGFPGVTDARWDADHVVRIEAAGGRMIHMINSVPGMSGGCVVDDVGRPVGLHEGAIPVVDGNDRVVKNPDGSDKMENRAVLLKSISEDIARRAPDALREGNAAAGQMLFDAALVTRLTRRGAQLLTEAADQALWMQMANAIAADEPGAPWVAHPWIRTGDRRSIEKWFSNASDPSATGSIAFIEGPRGCGKTFMIDVLKRQLPDPAADLIRVAWSEGDNTFSAIARQLAAMPAATGTRTEPGEQRYETRPGLIDGMASFGISAKDRPGQGRPLFLVIDAGDGTGSITEPDSWMDLVADLSQRDWVRVVLCGLPKDLYERLSAVLPLEGVDHSRYPIEPLRSGDVVRFLEQIGTMPGVEPPAISLKDYLDGLDEHPAAQSCMAALLAIGWYRGIATRPAGGQP